MQLTCKCAGCKEEFRKTEMVHYASPNSKTAQWYCPKCLEEKQERERFSNKVCQIFGIKSPGPIIWTQRKRLRDKFGYSDSVIIDCLDYIYNVKKLDKLSESLALVRPNMIEAMKQWKREQQAKASSIAAAIAATNMEEVVVPIKENTSSNKQVYNNYDGLLNDD